MVCPGCGSPLEDASSLVSSAREGPADIVCGGCGHRMSLDSGILSTHPDDRLECGAWSEVYSTPEDLSGNRVLRLVQKGLSDRRLLEAYFPLVRALAGHGPRFSSSIELGSGSGVYSLLLRKLGIVQSVTLVDYSMEALRMSQGVFGLFGEECNLVYGRWEDLPFPARSFDLSLSGGLIEHYGSEAERLDCLRAHLRLADTAYIQAPGDFFGYWAQRALITVIRRGWPFGFERPLGRRELESLARSAGARVMLTDFHYPLGYLTMYSSALLRAAPRLPRFCLRPFRTDIACIMEMPPSSG